MHAKYKLGAYLINFKTEEDMTYRYARIDWDTIHEEITKDLQEMHVAVVAQKYGIKKATLISYCYRNNISCPIKLKRGPRLLLIHHPEVRQRFKEGESPEEIAAAFKCTKKSVKFVLNRMFTLEKYQGKLSVGC